MPEAIIVMGSPTPGIRARKPYSWVGSVLGGSDGKQYVPQGVCVSLGSYIENSKE